MKANQESKDVINWFNVAWNKFKSVGRALRRGHIANNFMLYPKRPFNNRTSKKNSRPLNESKKKIYEWIRNRQIQQQVQ